MKDIELERLHNDAAAEEKTRVGTLRYLGKVEFAEFATCFQGSSKSHRMHISVLTVRHTESAPNFGAIAG